MQKRAQDARIKVVAHPSVKGTLVAIRIPGLLKKLDERFR